MALYALGLVKDEADVLAENITHALGFCDRIYYMDNGSTDGSWEIIEQLASKHPGRVIAYERTTEPYIEGMRNRIYNDVRHELGEDGWWLKLDADELLDSDPRPHLAQVPEADEAVRCWQVQFQFTDLDAARWEAGEEDPTASIVERRRYYRANWREVRLWRNVPSRAWDDVTKPYPPQITRLSRTTLVNRHYQYRNPEQMQHRLDVRAGDPHFPHQPQRNWRELIVPASRCHRYEPGHPWRIERVRYYLTQARIQAKARLAR